MMDCNLAFKIAEGHIIKDIGVRSELRRLSDEQLESLVENNVRSPVVRLWARCFKGGTSSLFRKGMKAVDLKQEEVSNGFYMEFNSDYVPTRIEYRIARELLEKRNSDKLNPGLEEIK